MHTPPQQPQLMPARYAGTCAACGAKFPKGTAILYDRAAKTARHQRCRTAAEREATRIAAQAAFAQYLADCDH